MPFVYGQRRFYLLDKEAGSLYSSRLIGLPKLKATLIGRSASLYDDASTPVRPDNTTPLPCLWANNMLSILSHLIKLPPFPHRLPEGHIAFLRGFSQMLQHSITALWRVCSPLIVGILLKPRWAYLDNDAQRIRTKVAPFITQREYDMAGKILI